MLQFLSLKIQDPASTLKTQLSCQRGWEVSKVLGEREGKKIEELSSMTTEQTPSADKDDVIWLRAQNSLEIDVVGDCDLGDDSSEAHIYCLHKFHYTK